MEAGLKERVSGEEPAAEDLAAAFEVAHEKVVGVGQPALDPHALSVAQLQLLEVLLAARRPLALVPRCWRRELVQLPELGGGLRRGDAL